MLSQAYDAACGYLYIHSYVCSYTICTVFDKYSHREVFNLWSFPLFFSLFLSLSLKWAGMASLVLIGLEEQKKWTEK